MLGGSRKIQKEKNYSTFKSIESIHPHKMILYLVLFGCFLVFSFMTFGFVFSAKNVISVQNIALPKIFTVGVILMLFSTYYVSRASSLFSSEEYLKLKDYFGLSLAIWLIFGLCQFIGLSELNKTTSSLTEEGPFSFLLVIVIIHGFHILFGIVAISYYLFKIWRTLHDPVKRLIVSTNPYEKTKLDMFIIFWKVMNFYWIGTFVVLLFTL